jgi:hypothetical protein
MPMDESTRNKIFGGVFSGAGLLGLGSLWVYLRKRYLQNTNPDAALIVESGTFVPPETFSPPEVPKR